MDLCKYTEKLWTLYSLGELPEIERQIFDRMTEDVVIIGTGKHEYYENLKQFRQSVAGEGQERSQISFQIDSFWCKEKKLNGLTSLVYGNLHLKGKGIDQNVFVDMNTRFSMIYCLEGDEFKLVHIHQSLPYVEQMEGEYYPKTLMDQVVELETLAKTDLLTGLLNHQSFYKMADTMADGYFMIPDLDDFKQINDTCGHLYGDRVLQEIGVLLREVLGEGDFAGRIGGDEFALFFGGMDSEQAACNMAHRIIESLEERSRQKKLMLPGISIGIARKQAGMDSMTALKHADSRMYEVKRNGKNGCQI